MKSPKSQIPNSKFQIPSEQPAKSDDSFLGLGILYLGLVRRTLRRSPMRPCGGVLLLLIPYTLLTSCSAPPEPRKQIDPSQFKEQLVKVNKYEIEKESDEINQYIIRHNWKMEKTGTGLRYLFLRKGQGDSAFSDDRVKVNYKISLLDGTTCYSSDLEGPYEFRVEGDAIESGLHEAVQLMRVGAKAKFILPSYMAHGLHGDDAHIPPLSPIVVDLELLEIR